MPLQIVRNDISKMKVDAVVDSADPKPVFSTGITRAIHEAAGPELMAARKEVNGGNLDENDIIVTPGFDLPAKYVFHVLSPYRLDGKHGEPEKLYDCYTKILNEAVVRKISSIAIPVLSSGNHLFSEKEAVGIALHAITDFLLEQDILVFLVVYSMEATRYACKIFNDVKEDIDNEYIDAVSGRIGRQYIHGRRNHHIGIAQQKLQEIELKERISGPVKSSATGRGPDYTIEEYVKYIDPGLYETVKEFLVKKGKKLHDLYTFEDNTGKNVITKQLISDIKKQRKQPSKRSVLLLALALKLNYEETQYLMETAGYKLTHSSRADAVVIYMLLSGFHDPYDLDQYLGDLAGTDLQHYK